MRFIEPHAHMVNRVTDDYRDMAAAGCAAVCEPAFLGLGLTEALSMAFTTTSVRSPNMNPGGPPDLACPTSAGFASIRKSPRT
jgi:hypothetical protein